MNVLLDATFLIEDVRTRILVPNVDDAEIDEGGRLDQVRYDLRRTEQKVTDAATDQFNRQRGDVDASGRCSLQRFGESARC